MALLATDLEHTARSLTEWLRLQLPEAADVDVRDVAAPAASGFSNETLFFTASWNQDGIRQEHRYVARLQPTQAGLYPTYDIGIQCDVMEALARKSDLPVPALLWREDNPSVLGAPFYVMQHVAGLVPADDPPFTQSGWVLDLSPADRARLCENALGALVRMHALDPVQLGLGHLGRPELGNDPLEQEIQFYENYYAWASQGASHPTVASGLAWARDNRPVTIGRTVLSWGDARIGNMIFAPDLAVVGVLDWDMVALGRPEQDLGWWLFFQRHHTEGFGLPHPDGFPRRDEVIARYEELSGNAVADMEFFEAFAAVRGAVIMVRLSRMMIDAGLLPADSNMAENNGSTRILADLLGLPAPAGDGVRLISKSANA